VGNALFEHILQCVSRYTATRLVSSDFCATYFVRCIINECYMSRICARNRLLSHMTISRWSFCSPSFPTGHCVQSCVVLQVASVSDTDGGRSSHHITSHGCRRHQLCMSEQHAAGIDSCDQHLYLPVFIPLLSCSKFMTFVCCIDDIANTLCSPR